MSNQEERQELLKEIATLRTYVSTLEAKLHVIKFGQLQWPKELSKQLYNKEDIISYTIPDVQTKLCDDLYRFLGIRCVKFEENRVVFEISGAANVTKNDLYAVEILIDDNGHGKLGKWVLPMYIDVYEILSLYPVNDLNNMSHFLKGCKHRLDCYVCRVKQLKEFQDSLLEFKNLFISHTIGITQIELTMLRVKDIDDDTFYNITLYLYYKSDETRPYKLLPDMDDENKLSAALLKRLNKYFKPFLKKDLNSAFLQISESQAEFFWKKNVVDNNEDNTEIENEPNDEQTGFLTTLLHKINYNKKPKKYKNKEHDESSLCNNEEDNSLFAEESRNISVTKNASNYDSAKKDEKIKSRKLKTILKLHNNKKSRSNLKESKKEVANIAKENNQSITNVSKTISNIASTAKRTLDKKISKNGIANTENAQMEDNYLLLEDDNNDPFTKTDNTLENRDFLKKSHSGSRSKLIAKIQKDENLVDELNNTSRKSSINFWKTKGRKKASTWKNKIEEKEKDISLSSNDNELTRLINSTPLSIKLPHREQFFDANHISAILSEKLD